MNRIDPDTVSDDALTALVDTHPNADAAMQRFNRAYREAERKPDQYDAAIAYLTERPDEIFDAWGDIHNHPAGCLFQYATKSGQCDLSQDHLLCGCLTQVRAGENAQTPELTAMIRRDSRIPDRGENITLAHLPAFAEWQRLIDYELKREPVNVLADRSAEEDEGSALSGEPFDGQS